MFHRGTADIQAMAAFLLVLFPLVFLYDTRLGAVMLVVAIVLLYQRGTRPKR